MLANYPSSSKLERVYEHSAQENLERTGHLLSSKLPLPFVNMDMFDLPLEKTRKMILVEGQLTLLSGVNIRLGGFH